MLLEKKKQTIIISAYKEYEYLIRLVKWGSAHFNVIIHIDNKSSEIDDDKVKELNEIPNVMAFKKYKITWGSLTHLLAVFDMLEMALEWTLTDGTIHTISGQDIPVKTYEEFDDYFNGNDHAYMWLESQEEMIQYTKNRYELRDFLWRYDAKAFPVRVFSKISFSIQKLFKKRSDFGGEEKIYKGLIYISAPYYIIKYVVDYVNSKERYFHSIRFVRVPEEFFFQTILANSKYKEKIIPQPLGYMDWESREAVLDESYIDMLDKSDFFFARKVESGKSKVVINHFLNEANVRICE